MLNKVKAKLIKIPYCQCGEPGVHSNISLGKIYTIYPESINFTPQWQCQTCKEIIKNVGAVLADDLESGSVIPRWFIFTNDMFEIDEGLAN